MADLPIRNPTMILNGTSYVETSKNIAANGSYEPEINERWIHVNVNVPGSGGNVDVGETLKSMLVLWLDGIKNAGADAEHSGTATTWTDLSGNGHNAVIQNGAWGDDHLSFNGESTYAFCPDLNPSVFTLEIAVKLNTVNSPRSIYHTWGDLTDNDDFSVHIRFTLDQGMSGLVSSTVKNGPYYDTPCFFPSYTPENLAVLTIKCDGKMVETYVNGEASGDPETLRFVANSHNVRYSIFGATITSDASSVLNCLDGNIYSVRIWNAGFSDSIVSQLAAETMERFGIGGS